MQPRVTRATQHRQIRRIVLAHPVRVTLNVMNVQRSEATSLRPTPPTRLAPELILGQHFTSRRRINRLVTLLTPRHAHITRLAPLGAASLTFDTPIALSSTMCLSLSFRSRFHADLGVVSSWCIASKFRTGSIPWHLASRPVFRATRTREPSGSTTSD